MSEFIQKPTTRYFPETNSMVIDIVPNVAAAHTEEIAQDLLIDYDDSGRIVAIEFPGGVRELLDALLAHQPSHPKARTVRESGSS